MPIYAMRAALTDLKVFSLLPLLGLAMLLGGCFTPLFEGATEFHDWYRRDTFNGEAQRGDPVAQYKLGNAYCCHAGGPLDAISVYNNNEATYWYCEAAHQGYRPAQLRLAQIYSGHVIKGPRIAQHASAALGNTYTDLPVALMWADIAARDGDHDAVRMHGKLARRATPEQRASAAALASDWMAAPCLWSDVFPFARTG